MRLHGPSERGFLKKIGQPRPLFRLFSVFFYNKFLQQIYVKKVHPVYSARIQTHDLGNVSHFP